MKIKGHSFRELINKFDRRWGLGKIEKLFFINWFNPFATLWLNLRSLPLQQALKFPIWCFGRPRFYGLSGEIRIEGEVICGMVKFNQVRVGSPNVQSLQSEIRNSGTIIFRGNVIIGTGNVISVEGGALLDIGSYVKITDMCNIGCFSNIVIGNKSRITHRCQIMDSNYHFLANYKKGIVPALSTPVYIGNSCWICNSSTISGGAKIPDYTIVASNSLVGKDFSSIEKNSLIGGIPAKYIASGYRKVENKEMEREVLKYYLKNPNGIYVIPEYYTEEICSTIIKNTKNW